MVIAAQITAPASVGWYVHPCVFLIPRVSVSQLPNNKSYQCDCNYLLWLQSLAIISVSCANVSMFPVGLLSPNDSQKKKKRIKVHKSFLILFFLLKEEDKNVSVIKSLLPCFLWEKERCWSYHYSDSTPAADAASIVESVIGGIVKRSLGKR